MHKFYLFILTLLLFSGKVMAMDPKCADLLTGMQRSFPIEKYYPNVKITNGYTPKGSKAFILWRSRTPLNIPDSAFNYHYMTKSQIYEAFGKVEPGVMTGGKITGVSPIPSLKGESLKLYKEFLATPDLAMKGIPLAIFDKEMFSNIKKLSVERYGSIDNFLREAEVTLEMTPERVKYFIEQNEQSLSFVIDGDGRMLLWSSSEQDKMAKLLAGEDGVLPPISHMAVWPLAKPAREFSADGVQSKIIIDYGTAKVENGTIVFRGSEQLTNSGDQIFFKINEYFQDYF